MTVPPNQPQRPSDELQPQTGSPPPTDTPPTTDAPTTMDDPATTGPRQPHEPAPPAAPPPLEKTYLSGIVTAGLAAICGAIFTSWAGVQGTLVGAMIGATIGSSVSEVVRAPLDSLERRLVAAGFSARRLRKDGVVKTVVTSPTAAQQAFGMVSRGAIVTVGATTIVGFLLAVGGVTVIEAAAGEPLAAIVADAPATGTTIGTIVQNASSAYAPDPAAGDPTSGRSGGGVTSSKPADPILGSEDPNIAGSPSPAATGTASNEAGAANGVASPEARSSPEATARAASTRPGTPTATVSSTTTPDRSAAATASSSPSAVQVVTVVVTATPTPSPTAATQALGAVTPVPAVTSTQAPVLIQTSTSTLSRTPTLTPTSTPVTGPAATTSPPAPAS